MAAVALRKSRGEGKISAIVPWIVRGSAAQGAYKIRRECNDGPTRSRISWRPRIRDQVPAGGLEDFSGSGTNSIVDSGRAEKNQTIVNRA